MTRTNRQIFFDHVAQTSTKPLAIEVEKAEGIYLYSPTGKKYIDLVSGVSVSNVGHCHPRVVRAVKEQAEKYMHLMVYGEMIQTPQTSYARLLLAQLPGFFDSIYYVNSGSEAIEGALKLSKRVTGRPNIIAFKNAYHGGTHGALSILGDEKLKYAFRPLLPGVSHLEYNNFKDLNAIDRNTACVVVEPIQAEAGIVLPDAGFLEELRKRCTEQGALLVFDEIQTGFGRTGKLFAFEHTGVVPDVIAIAKGMGGGMPIGGFISNSELMKQFTYDPSPGHITTFGGHPVSCAAANASLRVILDENLVAHANTIGEIFRRELRHERINNLRGAGLFLAVELDGVFVPDFMHFAAERGVVFDPFLFCSTAFRIAPPLIISKQEAFETANLLNQLIQDFTKK